MSANRDVPRVAVIATVYFAGSHADVIVGRLLNGYLFDGIGTHARVEVAALYLEQLGSTQDAGPMPDIGLDAARRAGVPRFGSVGEALGCGRPGVNVDGVVIIGEHGDFEYNVYGQKLYPRRRLFDAAVSAMVASDTFVPVFNDKHLAWSTIDAHAMLSDANRLGIPVLAGSTVPLAWREPPNSMWPMDAEMTEVVAIGFGPVEMYGFHILEGLQVHAERRKGGETGVASVSAMTGLAAQRVARDGTIDRTLIERALDAQGVAPDRVEGVLDSVREVFLIRYRDGLLGAAMNISQGITQFSASCRGPAAELTCQMRLDNTKHDHFTFLVRQLEALMLERQAPYPAERTFVTGGILDAAMQSMHNSGAKVETPLLDVYYEAPALVVDTGASRNWDDWDAQTT